MKRSKGPTDFVSDRSGAVAILFALAAIPVVLCIGLAVDSARAYNLATRTSVSLDAAALAAAKSMQTTNLSDAAVAAVAQRYYDAEIQTRRPADAMFHPITVQVNRSTSTLTLNAHTVSRNYFGGIIGATQYDIERSATATFGIRDTELGLMLDVSGSMEDSGKINDLKAAARDLFDIMLPDTPRPGRVRIGLAPFSTSVNLGALASSAKGNTTGGDCVSDRHGPAAFTDEPPRPGRYFGSRAFWCTTSEVLPITDNKGRLNRQVDAMMPAGMTAGHLGTAWAWYLISPNFASFWPSGSDPVAYHDPRTTKAVILMTDGMFNQAYEPSNGSAVDQALALCTNMKTNGVVVYAIGFDAPPEVLPTLQACASGTANFFDARNGGQLREAFRSIAEQLTLLRLTN